MKKTQETGDKILKKGRGATFNVQGRFDKSVVLPVYQDIQEEDLPYHLKTTPLEEVCKSIITTNDSPDIPFNRSINPYRGCEHGCIYCFARPSHAYLNLSPGLDFETKIFFKSNAAELLKKEFQKPSYQPEVIAVGANTDPYQPMEREKKITRGLLEVFLEYRHPVALITKSALVLRDLDILTLLAKQNLVSVAISITSLDPSLARVMEPRASSPARRLFALKTLREHGVFAGALASPMIPAINDTELENIFHAVKDRDGLFAHYIMLRLPHELKDLFTDWLSEHFPLRKEKVLHQIQAVRGGELYDSTFGTRMTGEGETARLLQARYQVCAKKLGLNRHPLNLETSHFVRKQLCLF